MLKFEKKVRRQKVKTTTAAATATENGPYSATSTVPAVYILTQQAATLNTWRTVKTDFGRTANNKRWVSETDRQTGTVLRTS